MTSSPSMKAMMRISPLHRGQARGSTSYVFWISLALFLRYPFDVFQDPGEQNNLIDHETPRAKVLQDHLREILEAAVRTAILDTATPLDTEAKKRLESMGYLGGGSAKKGFELDQSKDGPKDLTEFHKLNSFITQLLLQNKLLKQKHWLKN